MRHHQEPDGFHVELLGHLNVLFTDVGFGAVGRYSCHPDTELLDVFEIVGEANSRDEEACDGRVAGFLAGACDQFLLVDLREPVVEA